MVDWPALRAGARQKPYGPPKVTRRACGGGYSGRQAESTRKHEGGRPAECGPPPIRPPEVVGLADHACMVPADPPYVS